MSEAPSASESNAADNLQGAGKAGKPPHWEFAVEMGILDLERAAKISGAMFAMFRGDGAALARALLSYGLDRNSDLYEEILPPSLVRRDTMVRTGHLPKFIDDAYEIARDDLWPIPTGEVPLTSLGEDEILDESQLPMRFMAATPCYRREAGSAGRDTRGLLRVHEFQKVEILAYATEEQARSLHEELLERAVGAVSDLGLTYRIVDICTGDLGASSARTFDVEVYAPGASRWLECSSVSWFSDYQARRANIRYRPRGAARQPLRAHLERLSSGSAAPMGSDSGNLPPPRRRNRRPRSAATVFRLTRSPQSQPPRAIAAKPRAKPGFLPRLSLRQRPRLLRMPRWQRLPLQPAP